MMESNSTFGSNNHGVQVGTYVDLRGGHDERQIITDWLSPLSFRQKQQDVYADSQPGTGEWFLRSSEFVAWERGENNVLWCHGIPGSGKTVLASIVIEHLRQSKTDHADVGVIPIYCEYKLKELQAPKDLLASCWRELSDSQDSLAEGPKSLYAMHTRYRTKPTMDEIISIVQAEIRRYSAVYIVIDALDECLEDRKVRKILTKNLQLILTSNETKVRILVTSRFTNDIFPNANEIEIRATDIDLRRFVCQRIEDGLSDDDQISQYVQQNEAYKDGLIEKIVKRADKLFLTARLQLDSLATKTSVRSLTEAANSPPQNLDEFYLEAWNRVTNQNPDSRKDAQDALCWVSCSFRQLKIQELRHALATRKGDRCIVEEGLLNIDRLIRSCAGLMAVDKESQVVRLVHQTTQTFFDERKDNFFAEHHVKLAGICLTYLQFDESLLPPCDFESHFVNYATTKIPHAARRLLAQRLDKNKFMEYAMNNWGHHARGRATEESLKDDILTFLRSPKALASGVAGEYRKTGFGYTSLRYSSEHTPIHVAVHFQLEHILETLLREVPDLPLDAKDNGGKTAFFFAAGCGLVGCARLLMTAGADFRIRDNSGCAPLFLASRFGHGSIVKLVLEHVSTAKWTKQDIHAAILTTQEPAIERYIQAAPKPTHRANLIFMESSALGNPRIIEKALFLGADVNIEDQKGRTALLVAVAKGHSTAARALIASGASTTVLDESGKTLLQVAASSRCIHENRFVHASLFDKLDATRNRDINAADRPEMTYEALIRFLEDPEISEAMNVEAEYADIIRQLLGSGTDLAIKDSKGRTVLHLAAKSASRVKVLLEHGAQVLDIHALDDNGYFALHLAAFRGGHAAIEILLANGANATLKGRDGLSMLECAITYSTMYKVQIEGGSLDDETCVRKAYAFWRRTTLHYLEMMENAPQEALAQLHRADQDPTVIDSQDMTAVNDLDDDDFFYQAFKDKIRWIEKQSYERATALQRDSALFILRISNAQKKRAHWRKFLEDMNAENREQVLDRSSF